MRRRWRKGLRRPGRPTKPRTLETPPEIRHFIPAIPKDRLDDFPDNPIFLYYDEFEALRLVDLEDLSQEEAGERMDISRGTVWRLIEEGRKKVIQALIEGRELFIVPREAEG
ncbi:MAG: DUF134 domain-containing protein [Promethearchaeota archaeon]